MVKQYNLHEVLMSKQYLSLVARIIKEGVWVDNARTGKRCLTVINADFEYDCREGQFPMLTTKEAFWKKAVAEMLGYIKGLDNAADFRALGTDTWDANANAAIWQDNPYCKGKDDMGYCYGGVGRRFLLPFEANESPVPTIDDEYDQVSKVYNNLKQGIDDRREIITFWHPGTEHMACLPACMHTHTFSILDGTLYLTSYQRSDDIPLGHGFNQIQVAWFLMVMAKITGLKPGIAYHKIVNAHIYENQLELIRDVQMIREPYPLPKLVLPDIHTLSDLEATTPDDYSIEGYQHHPKIDYAFSV